MFQPFTLLEIAGEAFEAAGYSLSKIGIPSISTRLENSASRLAQRRFQQRYGHFIEIPSTSLVMRGKEVDLVETILNAGTSIQIRLENIGNPEIGTMERALELETACDTISWNRNNDPRFNPMLRIQLFPLKSTITIRGSRNQ